jgi:CO/xanthine dehydrogenase Mo-binding subunit
LSNTIGVNVLRKEAFDKVTGAARYKIRYYGEPVAVVVANSEQEAMKANKYRI